MTADEYDAWAEWYADLHGLRADADARMVEAWRAILQPLAEDDLHSASVWVAAHRAPSYRSEHLPRLMARIEDMRRERSAATRSQDGARECAACGWSGWVVVPHPLDLRAGAWVAPWRTCAVTCDCQRGLRLADSLRAHPPAPGPALGLMDYEEQHCGDWRAVMRRVENARRAAVDADAVAASSFGRVVRSIIDRSQEDSRGDAWEG